MRINLPAFLLFFSAYSFSHAESIQVSAYVDGVSSLVIQGDTVHWSHDSFAAPGLWNGAPDGLPQPTVLNGYNWYPTWPSSGDNSFCNCDSSSITGKIPFLSAENQSVSIVDLGDRGPVDIVEQPIEENGYRLVIKFDDYNFGGAGWYTININYNSGSPVVTDTDNDGIPDSSDIDDDNDGIEDALDQYPTIPANENDWVECGMEDDFCSFTGARLVRYGAQDQYAYITFMDGVLCSNNIFGDPIYGVYKTCSYLDQGPTDPPGPVDTDGDGIEDSIDTDDDNDGVPDASDQLPLIPGVSVDTDGDGLGDNWIGTCDEVCQLASGAVLDNCPSVANLDQLNTDDDAQGDACDSDDDNDGVPDVSDRFPLAPSEWSDTDNDGIGNNADHDDDNDGILDADDAYPTISILLLLEWTDCAGENEMCAFSGAKKVRYCAPDGGGSCHYLNLSDGTMCTQSIFGYDGYSGTKRCAFRPFHTQVDLDFDGAPDNCNANCLSTGMAADNDDDSDGILDEQDAYPTIPLSAGEWIMCAKQNDPCTFSGTLQVRYGAQNQYVYMTFTNGILCSDSIFGDPIYGVYKTCSYKGPTLTDLDQDGIPDSCSTDCLALGMRSDDDDDGDGVPDYIDLEPRNADNSDEIILPLNGVYKGSTTHDSNSLK